MAARDRAAFEPQNARAGKATQTVSCSMGSAADLACVAQFGSHLPKNVSRQRVGFGTDILWAAPYEQRLRLIRTLGR